MTKVVQAHVWLKLSVIIMSVLVVSSIHHRLAIQKIVNDKLNDMLEKANT